MIDMQGKHKIHISCCARFISKHEDVFVVDTETTKWITALPSHLHPRYWLWRIIRSLCSMRKALTTRTQGATATASAALVLALVSWPGILWFQPIVPPCLARPSVPVILTIAYIMGVDGRAIQVKFQPKGTTYPTYMQDKHIFVVGTFLMEHKNLILLHGQYHVCRWSDDPRSHAVGKREYSRTLRLISLLLMLLFFASPGHHPRWY